MTPSRTRTAVDILKDVQPDVNNRYQVKSDLGKGGMGTVDAVKDTQLDRILAMKTLSPKHAKSPSTVESFLKEARFTAQLQHPNIIPVHDVGTSPDTNAPFYTMKLIEGESLLEVIIKLKDQDPIYEKKYSLFERLNLFRKVCDALAYSHSRGIIHRDIKPANIMLGPYGEVLLVDWGLAKHIDDDEKINALSTTGFEDSFLTHDGIIKGSLAYLSPEQAFGNIREIDRLTDIFLLGATLYHLLTLEAPYNYTEVAKLLNHAENAKYLHPLEQPGCDNLPLQVTDIITQAMSRNKDDRFQSVEEISKAIDYYLSGKHASSMRIFKRGEMLIHKDSSGTEAYVVTSGRVEIYHDDNDKRNVLDICERGSIIGELSLLTGKKRSANAIAMEKTSVLIITRQMMLDELNKMPPWLEKTLSSLAFKLLNTNSDIHPFISASCALPVTIQTYYIFMEMRFQVISESGEIPGYTREQLSKLIADNLGLPPERTEGAINTLVQKQVLEVDSLGIITPIDLSELKALIKFIEMENSRMKDTSTIGQDIPVSKIRKFTETYRALNSI
ncbi:protein kinase [Lentisphaera profundi]|uniref:Protein kinase n=1 Tax=Lentisphaera profundi TaxID=1658616 RepID=A0ABY7VY18_9BACT|nr:protein kinase [Lentisphaera profundi]WDE98110.1 protein kinase [Lentisphaera profundi]